MRIQFVYSAALATVATIVAIDMTVQQLAIASQEVKTDPPSIVSKAAPASLPVVSIRYAANDPAVLCPIPPVLTTAKAQSSPLPKWKLEKMPLRFLWQQEVADGRRLVVELNDESGPVKGKIETFRDGSKESVIVTPNTESEPDELYLSAKVLDKDGKRVENWLLPIVIGEPE